MIRIFVVATFLLASLTAPAVAVEIDIGFDCAEGSDEDIVTPRQTPFPVPAPGS